MAPTRKAAGDQVSSRSRRFANGTTRPTRHRRRHRRVQQDISKPQQSPNPYYTKLMGFGKSIPRTLEGLYSMSGGNSTGGVTTHAELGLRVTDFFDYTVYDAVAGGVAQPVANYFWNVKQNLFFNGSQTPELDADITFCRPRRVHVYVLPVKGFEIGAGTGPNNNNAEGMFTVQAQTPGLGSNLGGAQAYALDTQVTNVLPQIDTFWKKVFTCNFDQTFKSGVARPYYATASPNDMCLFSMAVVDSTDGSVYLPPTDAVNLTIRVKVVVEVDQPISTFQAARLAVFNNESFGTPSVNQNGSAYPGTLVSYVQTDIARVRNDLR